MFRARTMRTAYFALRLALRLENAEYGQFDVVHEETRMMCEQFSENAETVDSECHVIVTVVENLR